MDANQLFDRLRQQLCSLQWSAQTVSMLVLGCVAVLGIVAVQRPSENAEQLTTLFENRRLSSEELQQIEVALSQSGLSYAMDEGKLMIPTSQRSHYIVALKEADSLPRSVHAPTRAALSEGGTFETSRQNAQRMHYALEQEARLAICDVPGIDDAWVFFDEKTERSLRRKSVVKAVVGVRTDPSHPLDLQTYQVILDFLLAFNVELTDSAITVIDLNARQTMRGSVGQPDSVGIQTLVRQSLEREWRTKIGTALAFIPESKINVHVVPGNDGLEAKSVRVAVGIPSTYLHRIQPNASNAEWDRLVAETRSKIQSTVQTLLPQSQIAAGDPDSVAVNVFDVAHDLQAQSAPSPMSISKWLVSTGLIVALGLSVAFLFLSLGRRPSTTRTAGGAGPGLRVFGADVEQSAPSSVEQNEAVSSLDSDVASAKLRAFVDEDPDAAAQSLSDFIDRAG